MQQRKGIKCQTNAFMRNQSNKIPQKKKCDERRPNCARCQEQGHDCVYEAIKPRQRRKTLGGDDDGDELDDENDSAVINSMPIRSRSDDMAAEPPVTNSHDAQDASTPALPRLHDDSSGPDYYDTAAFYSADTLQEITDQDTIDGSEFFTDNIEEIPNSSSNQLVQYHSASPITISPFFELNLPAFSEFSQSTSRRGLLNHFCNVMSHLIVLREDHGNPFQQLVVPLSHQSSAVKSAIYALSSAHLEFRGVANTETSIILHNEAIRNLSKLIEQGSNANRNELLAAIILLIYYEVVSTV